jgi:hypothetical protein
LQIWFTSIKVILDLKYPLGTLGNNKGSFIVWLILLTLSAYGIATLCSGTGKSGFTVGSPYIIPCVTAVSFLFV